MTVITSHGQNGGRRQRRLYPRKGYKIRLFIRGKLVHDAGVQMEDELRAKEEVREQLSAAEKRGIQLNGELEELRTQLEMSERSRKSAESEMNEAADRVSELLAANASLTSARRKLEADMHSLQVRQPSLAPA